MSNMTEQNLGQQFDAISARLDATTIEWAKAGHPASGPTMVAREEAFYALHRWTHRAEGSITARCETCDHYVRSIRAAQQ